LDQDNGLGIKAAGRVPAAGRPAPVQLKAFTMPVQEGLGLHDLPDGLPIWDPGREQQQWQAITPREAGRFGLTVQDHHLLAQEGVFGEQWGAVARQVSQRTGEGMERAGWVTRRRSRLAALARRSQTRLAT
jgi:hypothetical protein